MCYTYIGKDGSPKDCDMISTPIEDKVYLTGEHTNFEFMGTVNAGYISGVKAAERVLADYV